MKEAILKPKAIVELTSGVFGRKIIILSFFLKEIFNLVAESNLQILLIRFIFKNSNLVLIPENRPRNTGEPSGEPESLVGKIKYRFGDRAVPSKGK
jgi:hypothetical protein